MVIFKRRFEKINVNDIAKSFIVYNGLVGKKIKIRAAMIGHNFGEFLPTRKPAKRNK
jgi:ribosomal protein S19